MALTLSLASGAVLGCSSGAGGNASVAATGADARGRGRVAELPCSRRVESSHRRRLVSAMLVLPLVVSPTLGCWCFGVVGYPWSWCGTDGRGVMEEVATTEGGVVTRMRMRRRGGSGRGGRCCRGVRRLVVVVTLGCAMSCRSRSADPGLLPVLCHLALLFQLVTLVLALAVLCDALSPPGRGGDIVCGCVGASALLWRGRCRRKWRWRQRQVRWRWRWRWRPKTTTKLKDLDDEHPLGCFRDVVDGRMGVDGDERTTTWRMEEKRTRVTLCDAHPKACHTWCGKRIEHSVELVRHQIKFFKECRHKLDNFVFRAPPDLKMCDKIVLCNTHLVYRYSAPSQEWSPEASITMRLPTCRIRHHFCSTSRRRLSTLHKDGFVARSRGKGLKWGGVSLANCIGGWYRRRRQTQAQRPADTTTTYTVTTTIAATITYAIAIAALFYRRHLPSTSTTSERGTQARPVDMSRSTLLVPSHDRDQCQDQRQRQDQQQQRWRSTVWTKTTEKRKLPRHNAMTTRPANNKTESKRGRETESAKLPLPAPASASAPPAEPTSTTPPLPAPPPFNSALRERRAQPRDTNERARAAAQPITLQMSCEMDSNVYPWRDSPVAAGTGLPHPEP
ncbi:hypothetical protein BD410DRAFT_803844 [Rickenella mellea]|uniref:C2H2-type domain-containing protein n=1 Tax=Rickenella mellea TaxID=50990 RepID=A0A4Y7Q2Z9_9AGAM|nr:hypothetical protein BD410DRAFT_803844 [Rickenella mellea]